MTAVSRARGRLPEGLAEAEVHDRLLLVVAHPDDETIGAGCLLRRARDAWILHLTDGAPVDHHRPDPKDPVRLAYAELRRRELARAMRLARVRPERLRTGGAIDQAACDVLPRLVQRVVDLVDELEPDIVLTHPYEGGHPDHDAAAFAVHTALMLRPGPALVEMAYYHGLDGQLVAQRFLPGPPALELPVDRAHKARLFACHASQREALAPFSPAVERIRAAPRYDFCRPPHPGLLWYERQGWGRGSHFRAKVREALQAYDLGKPGWR